MMTMNVSQFTKAVRDMRAAQKAFFKERLRSDLIKSKELEKQVDQALKEGIVFDLDIVKVETAGQGELFDAGADDDQT